MSSHSTTARPGRLFYLMGASGAGKDSLMSFARAALGEQGEVLFAHRYITRPAGIGGENHVALSEQEFALRRRHGLFLFEWYSHGCSYAVGVEVGHWLENGLDVVVNGSRAYLPRARERVPALVPVLVQVSAARLAERLQVRGREDGTAVAARMQRGAQYADLDVPGLVTIDNDHDLDRAGRALLDLLCRSSRPEPWRSSGGA